MAELAVLMKRRIDISDEAIAFRRRQRARKNRRLQKGGTLSAVEARDIATNRDERDAKAKPRRKAAPTIPDLAPTQPATQGQNTMGSAAGPSTLDPMLQDFIPFGFDEDM